MTQHPEFRLISSPSKQEFAEELTSAHAEGFQHLDSNPMRVTTDAQGVTQWHMLLVRVHPTQ